MTCYLSFIAKIFCSVVFVLTSLLTAPLAEADDFSSELPRIPPTAPADALKTFEVADGYEMQLVAAEPLIGSPVAIEWAADGRMFVCEMRGYSEDQDKQISTIGLLSDTDNDGAYDHRTEFASGLDWPTAIYPYDGGLFVGDAPDLLYFKDTDGDGVADEKKVVLTGFGTSNVQGLMNSMRWGLDNRIHIACSSVGGQIKIAESTGPPVNVRGRDLAFDPRTYEFTPTSGAAQHGMCFDDWGRKFASSNSNHIMQVMYDDNRIARNRYVNAPSALVSIAVDGPQAEVFRTSPVEPWRIVRTRLRVSGKVSGPIEGGGRAAGYFTGATGITIYRGDAWPATDKGIAIVGDVGSNLIHRKRLEPSGLDFKAHRMDAKSEFVASTDIWFRPAQFANAPDGSLHVIDVCREVIEHPKSLPPEIKQHLDLTAGRDRGRIYRLVPTGFTGRPTPNLTKESTEVLVTLLAHPNAWHRETASRLIFERQDPTSIRALQQQVASFDQPVATLHAMYALSGLDALTADLLQRPLRHPNENVRRHAVTLADRFGLVQALAKEILRLSKDPSLAVRTEVAYAISEIVHPDRQHTLASIAKQDQSIWTRIAVQSSVPDTAAELFSILFADPDFRGAAASQLLLDLADQISRRDVRGELWMAINAVELFPDAGAAFVLPIAGPLLRKRGDDNSNLAKLAAEGYLKDIDKLKAEMLDAAKLTAADQSDSLSSRVAAIDSLAFGSFADIQETLNDLIDQQQPPSIQKAAVRTLGTFNHPGVASTLISFWPSLSPALRSAATECLLARPERVLTMFDAVDQKKVELRDLPIARLKLLTKSKQSKIALTAKQYLSSLDTGGRDEVVQSYQSVIDAKGDIDRGRNVFKKNCSACHKTEGFGNELGPNLAAMKNRGPAAILTNVLDPNREVNPQYLNYVLLSDDGRTLTGMITSETANSITLSRGEGVSETISRTEIETLQSTGVSIMPEGMEKNIDVQSMADLIAYLMQAK
ncbi:PVC-type heme-binding CxxCH protein [Planctomycetes bacterium K23_9]|uniref:Cytochrome c n=1 Tax=Stieleria marina TaxID=1930275 RepID=A0A517NMR9_9BACT|nr:Cytochrome c [Planctomycetes bacterium K23_9]